MNVALITTGNTEFHGLAPALRRLFPGHDFQAIADRPERPFACFTSATLPAPPVNIPTAADKIARRAVSLVDPAVAGAVDLVLVLEDLELANTHQPDVVIRTFAEAVSRHIIALPAGRHAELQRAARDQISIHFAVPMIEAWFFADPQGPHRAGVAEDRQWSLRPGDPENFHTNDQTYSAASESVCLCWIRRRRRRKRRPKWLGAVVREHHPKGYLQWLMRDGEARGCTHYDEVGVPGGRAALEELDWQAALRFRRRCSYLRALVVDLEHALEQPPALEDWAGDVAEVTRPCVENPGRIIRNH